MWIQTRQLCKLLVDIVHWFGWWKIHQIPTQGNKINVHRLCKLQGLQKFPASGCEDVAGFLVAISNQLTGTKLLQKELRAQGFAYQTRWFFTMVFLWFSLWFFYENKWSIKTGDWWPSTIQTEPAARASACERKKHWCVTWKLARSLNRTYTDLFFGAFWCFLQSAKLTDFTLSTLQLEGCSQSKTRCSTCIRTPCFGYTFGSPHFSDQLASINAYTLRVRTLHAVKKVPEVG